MRILIMLCKVKFRGGSGYLAVLFLKIVSSNVHI